MTSKLTREELEKALMDKLMEIRNLYYDNYPEGNYLTLCVFKQNQWVLNDIHDKDKDFPIDVIKNFEGEENA